MSSNPQREPWLSDEPKLEHPFHRPARIQAKKDYIPDDWEDDDGEGECQAEPIPRTMLQADAELPAQSQGRVEKIESPTTSAANSMASPIAKKRASPASYGDSGPSLPSFEPVMRILKRSTNPTSTTAAPITAPSQKSIVEREREYQQARERIFRSTSDGAISSNEGLGSPVVVQRRPRGPSSEDVVGFRGQSNQM